jgi:hypothetical protein
MEAGAGEKEEEEGSVAEKKGKQALTSRPRLWIFASKSCSDLKTTR